MIPFYEIQKQLLSDPEILDHFIMTEFDIIDDIKLQVIITNEENDIEIDEEEAEVIAKKYYENNKPHNFLLIDNEIKKSIWSDYKNGIKKFHLHKKYNLCRSVIDRIIKEYETK